jgi:RNA polymerase sigma-70 factor, ECF subfamily
MSESKAQPIDNAAFVRLWTTGSRRVYGYILTLVTNAADAEDLLQDVGVTAWEKFGEFDRSQDFVAWACGIAHFKVLGYFRSTRKLATLTDELLKQMHTEIVAMGDLLDRQHVAVQDCLARLPATDRELIRLRYAAGYAVKAISEQTGRTVAAVYKSLQRIHERLFQCVSQRLMQEARP